MTASCSRAPRRPSSRPTASGLELEGKKFTLQVAPEDCTGCGACVHNCPAKSKADASHKAINMQFQPPLREQEAANFDFFLAAARY